MGGQTLAEKIATRHCVRGPDRPLRAGDTVSLRPRHILTHDNSSAILTRFRETGAGLVRYPWQPLITLDHDVQNTDPARFAVWQELAAFAGEQHLEFRPCGSGVGHQIMVEDGLVIPGSLCVAADSHANIYGALGALGTPIVRSDAVAVWATGDFWWEVPRCVQVRLKGELREECCGKDLILSLCATFDQGEVRSTIVEFTGPGVASLNMDDRFTVANMTTEWGAIGGIFPVDQQTVDYLETVRRELTKTGRRRFTKALLEEWASNPMTADPDAVYSLHIEVDLASVRPTINGPSSPAVPAPGDQVIPIDRAFLVGCANARLGDLQQAAAVLRGRKVHPRVKFYVAAASRTVQDQAVRAGTWNDLIQAGARTLPPGCAMCIGLGEGLLEEGEVAVSATNRNYPGRMGAVDSQAWLASPAVVAQAALDGEIRTPAESTDLVTRIDSRAKAGDPVPPPGLVEGFPVRMKGEARFIPADSLDTDQIFPSTAVYRDLASADLGKLLLQNHDSSFVDRIGNATILVGGFNFGCGSSREQAATAFAAAGFELLIVGSVARTFRRNAANHGLLCLEAPEFVQALHDELQGDAPRTVALEDEIEVDFSSGTVRQGGREFAVEIPPVLIQELYLDGGVVERMRRRFGGEERS